MLKRLRGGDWGKIVDGEWVPGSDEDNYIEDDLEFYDALKKIGMLPLLDHRDMTKLDAERYHGLLKKVRYGYVDLSPAER